MDREREPGPYRATEAPPNLDQPPLVGHAPLVEGQAAPILDEEYYRRLTVRQRMRRLVLAGLLILATVLVLAVAIVVNGWSLVQRTAIDRTVTGNALVMNVGSADVAVQTWAGPGIHVRAIQQGGSPGDFVVKVVQSGGAVRVSQRTTPSPCWLFCQRSLTYDVSVPAGAHVAISTNSGNIDVRGVGGGVMARTNSGDVALHRVGGALQATADSGDVQLDSGRVTGATVTTSSGDIDLSGVAGKLILHADSGDITVDDARNARLDASAYDGDVAYTGSLARTGTNRVRTGSGDATLHLPGNSGFRLDASSGDGDISSDFALRGGNRGDHTLSGTAGSGGATLLVEVNDGDISIDNS